MGTLPRDLTARGRVALGDHLLDAARPNGFRPLWGRQIAVLPQEPWLSLDPLMRAGGQVAEAHHLVRGLGAADAQAQAASDLDRLGLTGAGARYRCRCRLRCESRHTDCVSRHSYNSFGPREGHARGGLEQDEDVLEDED